MTSYDIFFKLLIDDKLITIIISLLTLIVAFFIPRKIMVDQSFIALTEQYRSPEMGFAVLSLLQFYEIDCDNKQDLIEVKYTARYKDEVEGKLKRGEIDPASTLHFQRRLVAYFYWDLAKLYFEPGFSWQKKRQLLQMVTGAEKTLIRIVLLMGPAASSCFHKPKNVPEPPDDGVAMNELIKRLYDKAED